tara:strand:+ start:68199 stop:68588 length:390 start_codon:yes stop_codon:yes gene_type:complete
MSKALPYVSASEVAEASYCSYRLQNRLNKVPVSKRALKSAIRGNKKHDYQNRIGKDRRCFVATYAYGVDDYRTQQLRIFRDQVLACSLLGRCLIAAYYIVSPHLVLVARKFPLVDRILRKCLNFISSWV